MTWRREDTGYLAATAGAVAFLAYLIAGNFGLVPSPFSPSSLGEPPVVLAAEAIAQAPADDVVVGPATPPAPAERSSVPAAPPAPADTTAPDLTISTASGASVAVASGAYVEGQVRDIGSGVRRVTATFTRASGEATEVQALLTCDGGDNKACGWRADVPDPIGSYSVLVQASDNAGNVSEAGPIEITVVNTGNTVGQITDTVTRTPSVVGKLVTGVGNLLGL